MNQTPTPCAHGEPDAVTSRKSGSEGGGEETTGRKADMASRRRPNPPEAAPRGVSVRAAKELACPGDPFVAKAQVRQRLSAATKHK